MKSSMVESIRYVDQYPELRKQLEKGKPGLGLNKIQDEAALAPAVAKQLGMSEKCTFTDLVQNLLPIFAYEHRSDEIDPRVVALFAGLISRASNPSDFIGTLKEAHSKTFIKAQFGQCLYTTALLLADYEFVNDPVRWIELHGSKTGPHERVEVILVARQVLQRSETADTFAWHLDTYPFEDAAAIFDRCCGALDIKNRAFPAELAALPDFPNEHSPEEGAPGGSGVTRSDREWDRYDQLAVLLEREWWAGRERVYGPLAEDSE